MALDARGITRLLIRLGILAIGFAVTFIPVGLIVGWDAAGTYLVAAALLTIINSLVVAKLAAPSEPRQG
jgi:nucleoside permease NupC